MKIPLIVGLLAVMSLGMACGASPDRNPPATSTAVRPQNPTATAQPGSARSDDLTWQIYHNAEVGFSIQYPTGWQLETLADENGDQLHRLALKGPEGGLELDWGVGLGGACPDGYQPIRVAQGDLPACYSQYADGTEQWSLAGKQLGQNSFSGFIYTDNSDGNSREVVLQVLSTLSFP